MSVPGAKRSDTSAAPRMIRVLHAPHAEDRRERLLDRPDAGRLEDLGRVVAEVDDDGDARELHLRVDPGAETRAGR